MLYCSEKAENEMICDEQIVEKRITDYGDKIQKYKRCE